VLSNDSDGESETLSATLFSGPANGSVILAADGSFVYTPQAGFNGIDTFAYEVSDGNDDGVDVATVSIVVVGEASSPTPPAVAPGNLVVLSPTPGTVVLSWTDNFLDETRFEIVEFAQFGGVVRTVAANETIAIISGLGSGVSYHWDIRACNQLGCGPLHGVIGKTPDGSDSG
jgi:hypothetical protein